jgi:type II secretory pathway pseudopilin PulG
MTAATKLEAGGPSRGAVQRAGWTLIELLLVVSVVLMTLLFFTRSMGSTLQLTEVNRETGLALDGARDALERLQGAADFQELFRLYNSDPGDDPGLPGSGPGPGFEVTGLTPVDGDADGLVGEIRFPTVDGSSGPQLREDVLDEALGMPRDLDGLDGIDGDDHRDDYRLLPVEVTLRWKGRTGIRTLSLQTLLTER